MTKLRILLALTLAATAGPLLAASTNTFTNTKTKTPTWTYTPTPTATLTPSGSWTGSVGGTLLFTDQARYYVVAGGNSIQTTGGPGNGYWVDLSATGGTLTVTFTAWYTGQYKLAADINNVNGSDSLVTVELTSGGVAVPDTANNGNVTWNTSTTSSSNWQTGRYVWNGTGNAAAGARIWNLSAGTTYSVVFTTNSAGFGLADMQAYIDPADVPAQSVPTGTGLCANFYNGMALAGGSIYSMVDPTINHAWSSSSPHLPQVPATLFSASWTGKVQPPLSGNYLFHIAADDGVRLYINGTLLNVDSVLPPYSVDHGSVSNSWVDQSVTSYYGYYYLTAGAQTTIELDYYQNGGDDQVYLYWSLGPGGDVMADGIVPASSLFPACTGPSPTRTYTISPTATKTITGVPPSATRTPSPTISATNTPIGGSAPTPTPQVPFITSLAPPMGLTTGGNQVTITGINFTATTTFKFGPNATTSTATFISSIQMIVTAPLTTSIGVVDVTATNAFGTSSLTTADQYTYVNPIFQGLSPTARLYGLEYIPFPEQYSGGNSFTSLDVSFTGSPTVNSVPTANGVPKNTARWKIELDVASLSANPYAGAAVQVETRVGPYGVTCTSGIIDLDEQANDYNLELPSRPQNCSTSYFYLTATAVPPTQQFDAMGDPRFVPYLDMMSGSYPFSDNYNWYFRNLAGTNPDGSGATYKPFITMATSNGYGGTAQPNLDVPKLFALIREGVMISHSVYNSIAGYSAYYVGVGGEMGGDSSNSLTNGLVAYGGPWNSNSTKYIDEILGSAEDGQRSHAISYDGAVWVRTSSWKSMPYIGELWPDKLYQSDWEDNTSNATWGNLRNTQQSGSAYRDVIGNFDYLGAGASSSFTFTTVYHRNQAIGCATLFNGTASGSTATFNHSSQNPLSVGILNDGTVMGNDFNFAMPSSFSPVTRPWALSQGGNTPPEWSSAPYNGRRTTLAIYSGDNGPQSTVANTNWGFYDWSGGSAANFPRSSAAVRLYDTTGNIDPRNIASYGYFVVNGLAPSDTAGYNFVAQFSMLACLRTYLDAGAPTFTAKNNYVLDASSNKIPIRFNPVPYVEITYPTNKKDMGNASPIAITWTERYARWDDAPYTENYPCTDGAPGSNPLCSGASGNDDPTKEWHDGQTLAFNLKYSADNGATWYSCMTNHTAPAYNSAAGNYMNGLDSIAWSATNASHQYSYNWDMTNLSVGAGQILVRVECYRLDANGNAEAHYASHNVYFTTSL